jgi:hypothetical protein
LIPGRAARAIGGRSRTIGRLLRDGGGIQIGGDMLTDSASSGGNKPTQGKPAPAAAGGGKPNPGATTRSVPAAKPAALPAAPGRQPTAQIPAAAPGRQPTAQIPAAAPGRQATAQIPAAAPARQATARIPAVAPARQATAQIPVAAPARQATAQIPAAAPARQATAQIPAAAPVRQATAQIPVATRPATTTRPAAASPVAGTRPVTTTRPVAPPAAGGARPVTTVIPAVPAAAPPGTARIPTGRIPKVDAAAGPRSTGTVARVSTGRIPVAAPSSGGTSTRVPRVTTGRVPVSPDAARTTASLRRATRTTAVRKQGSATSPKVRAIAVLAILGLGGAVAGLAYVFSHTEKTGDIQKRMGDDFKKCSEMPDTDILRKDEAFRKLMASDLDPKSTVQIRGEIERYYNSRIKERASMERDALRVVPAYFKKYDEGRADAARQEALYDEIKALKEKFGYTSFGPKIDEISAELLKALESKGRDTWEVHFPELQSAVGDAVEKGDARAAIQLAKDFGGKWKEGENADVAGKLKELREKIQRESVKFANKRIRDARKLFDEGKKDDAAKLLRDARPGLEGSAPEALAEIDKVLNEMKK